MKTWWFITASSYANLLCEIFSLLIQQSFKIFSILHYFLCLKFGLYLNSEEFSSKRELHNWIKKREKAFTAGLHAVNQTKVFGLISDSELLLATPPLVVADMVLIRNQQANKPYPSLIGLQKIFEGHSKWLLGEESTGKLARRKCHMPVCSFAFDSSSVSFKVFQNLPESFSLFLSPHPKVQTSAILILTNNRWLLERMLRI